MPLRRRTDSPTQANAGAHWSHAHRGARRTGAFSCQALGDLTAHVYFADRLGPPFSDCRQVSALHFLRFCAGPSRRRISCGAVWFAAGELADVTDEEIGNRDILQAHHRLPAQHLQQPVVTGTGSARIRLCVRFTCGDLATNPQCVMVLKDRSSVQCCASAFWDRKPGHPCNLAEPLGLSAVVARPVLRIAHSLKLPPSYALAILCMRDRPSIAYKTTAEPRVPLIGRA